MYTFSAHISNDRSLYIILRGLSSISLGLVRLGYAIITLNVFCSY